MLLKMSVGVMRRLLWDFPNRLQKEWNRTEIRVFVLLSLSLQILLILFGSHRKRSASVLVTFILWMAYLSADWVAIYALGVLSNSQGDSECNSSSSSTPNPNDQLLAFWAPFLLLHLGGPDTITSFSLEDNALWLRHGLGLIFQVGLAIYIFVRTITLPFQRLFVPSILMFVAGILKYIERTFALYRASMDGLKNSLITDPDPGPNYAKLMEEYASNQRAGLPTEIVIEQEPDRFVVSVAEQTQSEQSEISLLYEAHRFFNTFKRLIVDLILTFHDRNESLSFITKITFKQAFNVIEMELNFVYDVLYTKAGVAHTIVGRILRILCTSSIVSALVRFSLVKKNGYRRTDVDITYVLLYGALALDFYALVLHLFSDWTVVLLRDKKYLGWFQGFAFKMLKNNYACRGRWSNCMGQYNLITFCLCDSPKWYKKILKILKLKDLIDIYWYTKPKTVHEELNEFIFQELISRSTSAQKSKDYKHFCSVKGEWALERRGYLSDLGWSVQKEFDENLLLWHIATELCYIKESADKEKDTERKVERQPSMVKKFVQKFVQKVVVMCQHFWSCLLHILVPRCRGKKEDSASMMPLEMCKVLSDYLLYILVAQPFMLSSTAGIGQVRFGDTCAEAKNFFRRGEVELDESGACDKLLNARADVEPVAVKGDRSKSVLWDACRLAHKLENLGEKKWNVMREVWVEMLSFAASQCRGNFHARRLSQGGELLTFVWFLMAHLGLGEQFRIEAGHARAKLIVSK